MILTSEMQLKSKRLKKNICKISSFDQIRVCFSWIFVSGANQLNYETTFRGPREICVSSSFPKSNLITVVMYYNRL